MSVGLTAHELSRVFPFYIACDTKLRVTEVGRSLTRLCPRVHVGQALADVCRFLRPAGGLEVTAAHADSVAVLLELSDPVVVLRGQALARPDGVLLLVSPWVTEAVQLGKLGLNLHDFADHDPLVDYLSLLQAKNSALSEARALGARLQEASKETERALEERKAVSARLEALIRRLPFGVLVEDEAGKVVLTNEKYMSLFGLPGTPADLIDADRMVAAAGASVCFRDPNTFVSGLEARTRARRPIVAEELPLSDGRTFERDYVPIFDAQTYRGHMWQYRDVTDQRRASLQLSAARERAEVANATKGRFLAMMSHEIRTPLSAIVGLSDLLGGQPAPGEQRDLVERLGRNARHLIELLEDILDFAKIEAGEVQVFRTPFDPRSLVREAIDPLETRASDKGLKLEMSFAEELPSHVIGDTTRLRQVITNLVSNAIKFTAKGRVLVQVAPRGVAGSSTTVAYEVSDTGRGIPRDAHDRIFHRFVRITQVDGGEHVPGTGLGLSIVRGLVTLMGGTIELDSEVNKGSTFRVLIPHELATPEQARRSVPAPRPAKAERPARLLLLEDDADNRAVLCAMLEQAGHRVEAAQNGQIGLERATRVPYDLVLTDLQMPVVNGLEFARQLREHERQTRAPRTPVVAVTAHAIPSFRERALAAGMDDFASKPLSSQVLADLVQRWADVRPLVVAVDDVPDNLFLLQRTLGVTGNVRLYTVDSGRSLLELADRRPPDLVLLDMSMPEMSGYEVAQRLRARSDTRTVPIVALTAHSAEDESRRCREVGCNAHLVKPARPRVLEMVVDKLLAAQPRTRSGAPRSYDLQDVIPEYLERRKRDMEAVLRHLEHDTAESRELAARLAHNAKGSGGAYGFQWLTDGAAQLEVALQKGELERARALTHELLRRLSQGAALETSTGKC